MGPSNWRLTPGPRMPPASRSVQGCCLFLASSVTSTLQELPDEHISQFLPWAQIGVHHDGNEYCLIAGCLPLLPELRRRDVSPQCRRPSQNSGGHDGLQRGGGAHLPRRQKRQSCFTGASCRTPRRSRASLSQRWSPICFLPSRPVA